ncbi:MAG: FixH family protein [Pseudomonadales bacterium]
MNETTVTPLPWYKQFWPWFIFLLPASVVVAGITTVFIAVNNADSLVQDNYYREGLAINQTFAREEVAARLNIAADVSVDKMSGELHMTLVGDIAALPPGLTLLLSHPLNKSRDLSLYFKKYSGKRYVSQLEHAISGRWYLQLAADLPEPWLLKGEVVIDASVEQAHFKLQPAPRFMQ